MELELLKSNSYDEVSTALAAKLGLDHPLKLRFTGKQACECCAAMAGQAGACWPRCRFNGTQFAMGSACQA